MLFTGNGKVVGSIAAFVIIACIVYMLIKSNKEADRIHAYCNVAG